MPYLSLSIAILAEVIATSMLKSTNGFSSLLPTVVVITAYGIAFVFLAMSFQTMNVGMANAIWSGAGIVLISLAGFVFYGQRIDLPGLIGLTLIIAGVAVVQMFSDCTVAA